MSSLRTNCEDAPEMETVLRNGRVIDGTGCPPQLASIVIKDGKIARVVTNDRVTPQLPSIDCTGLIIAPGFIDVHTHSDWEVLNGRTNKILQGVTTEVVGNCSYSLFPEHADPKAQQAASIFEGVQNLGIRTARDYFHALELATPLFNVASLTGHSALRNCVIGMRRRPPSAAEQTAMEELLDRCLEEGSIGFSTGLNCLPSSFAGFEELVGLCRVLKRHGAYYTTHMRDYKFRVVEAVEEAIQLAERADVPVQLSHVQVVGKKCWPHLDTILHLISDAARRGIDIGIDAYPYLAGSCSLVQFLPEWCQDGGLPALLERLDSSSMRDRIARETEDYMSNTWADLIVCGVKHESFPALLGKSLERIAAERETTPRDAAVNLLREQGGNVHVISFNSCDENLRLVLTHPLTSVCSDSFIVHGLNHPRTFGTYPIITVLKKNNLM